MVMMKFDQLSEDLKQISDDMKVYLIDLSKADFNAIKVKLIVALKEGLKKNKTLKARFLFGHLLSFFKLYNDIILKFDSFPAYPWGQDHV